MSESRSAAVPVVLGVLGVMVFATLLALGTWQVKRLYWKLDLIERVERRVHAAPFASPGPEYWSQLTRQADEYRHVHVTGTFLPESTTLVQAVTDLGSGFWLLTALRTADGVIVLVNRGFVPSVAAATVLKQRESGRAQNSVTVTGLLRMSEPGGGFLRFLAQERCGCRALVFARRASHCGGARPVKHRTLFHRSRGHAECRSG